MDCVGLLIVPTRSLGIHLPECRNYDPTMPDPAMMRAMLDEHLEPVGLNDCGPGRVGLCRRAPGVDPMHIVVMLRGRRIAHADASVRRIRCDYAEWLDGRIVTVYRVPGIDYGGPWL